MEAKNINLDDFDARAESGAGSDLPLKATDGLTDTGVVLVVIGKHADPVVQWNTKMTNEMVREQQYALRRGKPIEPKSMEVLREKNIDGAAMRVVGWKNVVQEFSPEVLKAALRRNPHWVDQIVQHSDDMGNFTKTQQPTS